MIPFNDTHRRFNVRPGISKNKAMDGFTASFWEMRVVHLDVA
jgi:hypothetical protein